MLVEDEQRMITTTTKMAVLSRGFLPARNSLPGRRMEHSPEGAFGAVDVQDQIR